MRNWQRVVVVIIIIVSVPRAWERERSLNMWRLRWLRRLEGVGWSRVTLAVAVRGVDLRVRLGAFSSSNRRCIGVSTVRLGPRVAAILSLRTWGFSLRYFGGWLIYW